MKRYHQIKRASEKECKKVYKDYIHNIISPDLTNNTKRFWGFIKSRRCDSVGVSPLKDTDGITYSDIESKANVLNHQFSSVFNCNEDKNTIPCKGQTPHTDMKTSMLRKMEYVSY
jgi:hypothetical protein